MRTIPGLARSLAWRGAAGRGLTCHPFTGPAQRWEQHIARAVVSAPERFAQALVRERASYEAVAGALQSAALALSLSLSRAWRSDEAERPTLGASKATAQHHWPPPAAPRPCELLQVPA